MARKLRIFLANTSMYVFVKGINKENIFKSNEDYKIMNDFINKNSELHNINIKISTLLKSSFYLIISSNEFKNISSFMQALGRNYVGYYNKKYQREGSLFQGRYKTSLIDETMYLEDLKRYFVYLKENEDNKDLILDEKYSFFNECINKQNVIATKSFKIELEEKLGVSLENKKRGRPIIKRNTMYKKLVKLNKEKHKDLKIQELKSLSFAKNENSFPILVSEIFEFHLMFPLVFTGDENPQIIALTTIDNVNVSITNEGKFTGKYLPAYYKKYPFTFIALKDKPDQKVVAIDEEAVNVSFESGIALFEENMEQSVLLKEAIKYLTSYEEQAINTLGLAKLISDSNILEDREISIDEGEEKKVLIKGFKVVSREKLNQLDDETLSLWVRNGIISLIDLHLRSLDNLEKLIESVYSDDNI